MTDWPGDITAYRNRDTGAVRLDVIPGPMRATRAVLDQADPEWASCVEDLVIFHSIEADGMRRAYRYRITGFDPAGPEGGWLLLAPLPDWVLSGVRNG